MRVWDTLLQVFEDLDWYYEDGFKHGSTWGVTNRDASGYLAAVCNNPQQIG